MNFPIFSGHSSRINCSSARACRLGSGSGSRYKRSTGTGLRHRFALNATGWEHRFGTSTKDGGPGQHLSAAVEGTGSATVSGASPSMRLNNRISTMHRP